MIEREMGKNGVLFLVIRVCGPPGSRRLYVYCDLCSILAN